MIKKILFVVFLFYFAGCDGVQPRLVPPVEEGNYYVVINEGLYGQNNSSVTLFDVEQEKTLQNVYADANGGADLGDTANDFAVCCGKGFIVLDKSKKIEIVNLANFSSLGFIDFSGLGNPRNIVVYDSSRAFVSALENSIVEINPRDNSVVDVWESGSMPEGVAVCEGKLFVANSGFGTGKTVSVFDLNSDALVKTISVKINPRFIVTESAFVYVISAGEYLPPGEGAITKINAQTLEKVDSLALAGNPTKATIAGNSLFVIYDKGVARISLEDFTFSDPVFIAGNEVNSLTGVVYSIFYDNLRDRFLLGNPKDFMQNGTVAVFSSTGEKLFEFACGLNPGIINFINNK